MPFALNTAAPPAGCVLFAFDPGADTGWGIYDGFDRTARLIACGLYDARKGVDVIGCLPDPSTVRRVHAERPKIYPKSDVPPHDMITLAIRAGEIAGPYRRAGAQVTYYEPKAWKGSLDKAVHHARVWGHLEAREQALIAETAKGLAPSKRHNLMDGVALGLFAVGRTKVAGL